jgi:hypothetical protein
MPQHTAVALYVTAAVAMLLFVRLLTHMTIIDNKNCAAAAAAAAAAAQAALPPPACTQPAPATVVLQGSLQQQQQQQLAPPGPSKDVAQLSCVPLNAARQPVSLAPAGSGQTPEYEDSLGPSPFALAGCHHSSSDNSRSRGRWFSSSNASIYFSSRSLPVCEESIPGAASKQQKRNMTVVTRSGHAPEAAHAADAEKGESSLGQPLESITSTASCSPAGGFDAAATGSAGTASGILPAASGAATAATASATASYCRPSDILKVLVLYLQVGAGSNACMHACICS